MKKYLTCLGCFVALSASAQMIDALGSLGVQGAIIQSDAQSMKLGSALVQENQIIQKLTQLSTEIRLNYAGQYQHIDKARLDTKWDVGSIGSGQFYIVVPDISRLTCRRLAESRIDAQRVINDVNDNANNCSDINRIKFIFD